MSKSSLRRKRRKDKTGTINESSNDAPDSQPTELAQDISKVSLEESATNIDQSDDPEGMPHFHSAFVPT